MSEEERAQFEAVLPFTQSAIRVHGDSGMRITFDIDETNLGEAMQLVKWRGYVLRVTIEPIEEL